MTESKQLASLSEEGVPITRTSVTDFVCREYWNANAVYDKHRYSFTFGDMQHCAMALGRMQILRGLIHECGISLPSDSTKPNG
jgi:hypothetical protein